MFKLLAIVLLATTALASKRYDNFKVFEIEGKTDEQIAAINELERKSSLLLDVWRGAGRELPAHISVSPQQQGAFKRKLQELGLDFKVVVENVQDQIDEVDRQMNAIPKNARNILNSYYNYEQNKDYLEGLRSQYNDRMSIVNFGKSRYNRDLFYVKLSSDRYSSEKPEDSKKQVIWMESTTHAREWITNACILNLIEWLMANYGSDSDATFMLDKFDWFIVPVQNPDGYAYSFSNDRMWRKTRTTGSCISWQGQGNGVDPNRNWSYGWGINGQTNRCAADYQGPSALSEPCTSSMAAEMDKTPSQYRKAFLSLHSYSQLILTPYGYDRYASVPNYSEQVS
ncbi:carboxypeptidase A2-like [Liolophura sinensis]|uniref:carboxypeptidase A2-like n=1 Tax=Liolophura sinensis TaxID=3198878 RepID=UPI0031598700